MGVVENTFNPLLSPTYQKKLSFSISPGELQEPVIFPIENWEKLQEMLKEENNTVHEITEKYNKLFQELIEKYKQYFCDYVKLMELEEISKKLIDNQKEVCTKVILTETQKSELFENAGGYLTLFIENFVKNPNAMIIIIEKNNNNPSNKLQSLAKALVNTFYDNIYETDIWNHILYKFLAKIIMVAQPSD